MSKHLSCAPLAIVTLALASLGSHATVTAAGVVDRGLAKMTVGERSRQVAIEAGPVDPDLQTIVDTFKPTTPTWDAWMGWTLSVDEQPAVAMSFVPQGDYTVHEIRLALTNLSGSEQATVTLNADAGGIPGQTLAKFKVKTMPRFGKCCATRSVSTDEGVRVSAGQTYWVAAHVPKKFGVTDSAWNVTLIEDLFYYPMAVRHGDRTWFAVSDWASAFAVYGKPIAP